MRAIGILFIAVFFTLGIGGKKVNGQTVAIGHVCAEVVESVSAASATISDFELTKSNMQQKEEPASATLNLGAITINSGKDITCNIVLTSAAVTNDQGNAFTIEPAVQTAQAANGVKSNGIQTVKLGANANMSDDQASGLYEGSYTVIFAYN
jgi:hypothetical protein